MSEHKYKEDSVNFEQIPDGYYSIGTKNGVPDLLFFGEMSVIKKIEKHFIGTDPFTLAQSIKSVDLSVSGEILIGLNVPGTKFYCDNKLWYYYSKMYIKLPQKVSPPDSETVIINSQINQSGVTLKGEPVISGTTKGVSILHTYLGDTTSKVGETVTANSGQGVMKFLITSLSKNNKRYINGELHYSISINYQEF